MNSRLFSISTCLIVLTQGSLFGMRSITNKTSSRASQSLAAATGASNTFSTRPWPTQEEIKYAQANTSKASFSNPFSQQQSNQQKSDDKSQSQENQKSKWYKAKSFKYPAAGIVVAGRTAELYKRQKDKEWQKSLSLLEQNKESKKEQEAVNRWLREKEEKEAAKKAKEEEEENSKRLIEIRKGSWAWAISDDIADVDPELYSVILKIKKDIGIAEDVPVRIAKKGKSILPADALGAYNPRLDCIFLQNDINVQRRSNLIHILVHEFEHYRQNHNYHGSFHVKHLNPEQIKKTNLSQETGADAASAGYFDCPDCLKEIQADAWPHNPHETDQGHFSTPKGYFSNTDYDDYIKNSECEERFCAPHKDINNYFKHLRSQIKDGLRVSPEAMADFIEQQNSRPLKDFLPEKR